MTNKYLEKASGLFSAAAKIGKDLTGQNVKNATKAFKTDKTRSFLELNKDLKTAIKDKAETTVKAKRAASGAAGGVLGISAAKSLHEKKASANKYLEKIAGIPGGIIGRRAAVGAAVGGVSGAVLGGKDNRIKGALAGAAAGGVAGSVFGKAVQAKKMKNIIPANSPLGAGAKLLNPKLIA